MLLASVLILFTYTFIPWDALLCPLIVLFWSHLSFLKTKMKRERVQVTRNRVGV